MLSFTNWMRWLMVLAAAVMILPGCQENTEGKNQKSAAVYQAAVSTAPRASHPAPEDRNLWTSGKKAVEPGRYEPGFLLIKFRDGVNERKVDGMVAELGLRRVQRRSPVGVERLALDTRETVPEAAARLSRHPQVIFAEPNYEIHLLNVPNDDRYDELWGMNNTGQTGGTADADIDAEEAWDITIGSYDVIVAVLDTGVDYNHPDLADNMWTNEDEIDGNGVDDDGNGYVDDVRGWNFEAEINDPADWYGHGTHCAGTIGAIGNNGLGVAGVNWRVTIMPLMIIGNQDYETYCLDAAEGIQYAVDNGADVMSCSWWTVQTYSQTLEDTVSYANDQGVILVAAAGNDSRDTDDPNYHHWPSEWPYDNIIAVAATNHDDGRAYFSNFGPTSVDVGAPGEDILSTSMGGGYELMSGTSMATPHTAGVVALMKSIRPDLTMAEIKQFLFTTVDPIPDLQGLTITGGRINAFTVLQAISGVPLAPVALAGGDQTVMTGTQVTLDGSSSFDPNQDPITYLWEFYPPGHSAAVLSDDTSPTPTFVADVCGEYQAFLTVEDDGGLTSGQDRARVNAMNWSDQSPPIETAHPYGDGEDQTWTITQPGAVVIGVHFASFDTEGNYDFVRILDADDQEWAIYDGNLGEFNSVIVDGNTLKIHFTSDGSATRDGFVVDGIWWCDAGRCPPGLGDCDDDPGTGPDGCETDTSDDIDNCGWCAHACAYPHASANCVNGICEIDSCDSGWTDCDGDTQTGCEADLLVDPENCGACGDGCGPYPNATPGCSGGSCAIGECDPGWDDCDGVLANGCERDVTSDVDNCGACSNVCDLDHATAHICIDGICHPGSCADEVLDPVIESLHPYAPSTDETWTITRPGAGNLSIHFASFDTERQYDFVYIYDGNDVEYARYDGDLGAFQSVAVPGDTIKIRLTSDSIIERDGFVIDGVRNCQSGCEAGWDNCDGDPANGCESDVSVDVDNCGACGQVCGAPNMNNQCIGGTCQPGDTCLAGYGDCDGDPVTGCEVDLLADPDHCNACGAACAYDNAFGVCMGGACQMGDCYLGWGDCNASDSDGCEVNLVGDGDNCGACGNVCDLPNVDHAYCEGGVCAIGDCQVMPENIQTPHPYDNGMDLEWTISHPGASEIQVHFSLFDVEDNSTCGYDYVRLYDGQDNEVATYCGALGPFVSDPVPGETVRVVFHSDGSVTRDGFIIDWSRSGLSPMCEDRGCATGWDDCDDQASTGCESDVSADPDNCGACGDPCVFDHGTGDCVNSACVVASCDAGWGDCNADGRDGCETDLNIDPDHCSACGSPCAYDHATGLCQAAVCAMGACDTGYDDCNVDDTDGCEVDLMTDPLHCDACDAVCGPYDNATPGCAGGTCILESCDFGWDDCDNAVANGCEADVSSDYDNCGACNLSCAVPHATDVACVDSVCVIAACEDGWGACDADERNGCETDLANDDDNCGACGTVCTYPNGSGVCQDGTCTMTSCATGFADCNEDASDGCEVSLREDAENCGYCGNACTYDNATGSCVDGRCEFGACDAGYQDCNADVSDGCEVHTDADPDNCGACGTPCDLANATAGCDAGACTVTACDEGYGDCDGDAANGCEVDTDTSLDHCGACDAACALDNAVSACNSGNCEVESCETDFNDCNSEDADGCEADLNSDEENCGTCRHSCGEGQACAGGDCNCPDADGDGHGAPPCDDDCDDTDPERYPGREEICDDEIDNDCDGDADEGCPDNGDDTEGGGCGCGTKGAKGIAGIAWLGLLGLLVFRRRS